MSDLVVGDYLLDNGLAGARSVADKIFVCDGEPSNYTDALSMKLGEKDFGAGNVFNAPEDPSPDDGRLMLTAEVTDGSVTADGTVSRWAIVASGSGATGELIAHGALTGGDTVTNGSTFTLGQIPLHLFSEMRGYDEETIAWISAVEDAGGSVTPAQQARVNALIVGLKADGLFSANSRLWLTAGEKDSKQATTDLMGLVVATPSTTPPTLIDNGYKGNGTSAYMDLGAMPSDFTQYSGSIAAYYMTNSTAQDTQSAMGCSGGASIPYVDLTPLYDASGMLARINQNPGDYFQGANANKQGFYVVTTTADTVQAVYKNGNLTPIASGTKSDVSGTLPNMFGLATNANGSPGASTYSSGTVGAWYIGPGLTALQAQKLAQRINAYMIDLGVNVFGDYVGPDDIAPGSWGWWGLRAFNSAKIGTACVRIKRADNAEQDILLASNGYIDTSDAFFNGSTPYGVIKLYDQTGNGLHLDVPGAGGPPVLVLNDNGSLPCILSSLDNDNLTSTNNCPAGGAQYSGSTVCRHVVGDYSNITTYAIQINSYAIALGFLDDTHARFYNGVAPGVDTGAITGDLTRSLQVSYSYPDGEVILCVDGVNTNGMIAESKPMIAATVFVLNSNHDAHQKFWEAGWWNNNISPQFAKLSANQRAAWSF